MPHDLQPSEEISVLLTENTAQARPGDLVAALRAGEQVIVVEVADDTAGKVAADAATIAACLDGDTRVLHAGNPLHSPLTIDRILFQLRLEGGELEGDEARDALRAACAPDSETGKTVLVIEQADSLDPDALTKLKAQPSLRLVLIGRSGQMTRFEGQRIAPVSLAAFAIPAPSIAPLAWRPTSAEQSRIPDPPSAFRTLEHGLFRRFDLMLLALILLAGAASANVVVRRWMSEDPADDAHIAVVTPAPPNEASRPEMSGAGTPGAVTSKQDITAAPQDTASVLGALSAGTHPAEIASPATIEEVPVAPLADTAAPHEGDPIVPAPAAETTVASLPPASTSPNLTEPAATLPSPTPGSSTPAASTLAAPSLAAPSLAASSLAAPVRPTVRAPSKDTAKLRAEFASFLARTSSTTSHLSPRQREALFEEYRAWHARQAASDNAASGESKPDLR